MSETAQAQARADTRAGIHRREFLSIAPSAALASSIPLGVPRPSGSHISLREALAALWDHSGEGSGCIIKPSTAERLDSLFSGCNVGLISASRSDLTMDVNQGRCARLWAYIWSRFGSIDVDVSFSEHGPLQTQTLMERCYLLLGRGFDNGNLRGSYASMERSTIRGLFSTRPTMREARTSWARKMVWFLGGNRLSASGSLEPPD
jgi:hypothetical protein